MKTLQGALATLAAFLVPFALALPARAQLPTYNQVCLGGATTENLYDTLSAYGLTANWAISSHSLVCTFKGTPERATNWIVLSWSNPAAGFPLNCRVTSTTGASYDFEAVQVAGSSEDTSLNASGLTGNFVFGQYFPALDRLDVFIRPNQVGATYDLAIKISWGAGTPVESRTLGDIKALYR